MALAYLCQHCPVVSCYWQIATFVQLSILKAGPVTMHLAACYITAQQPHSISVSMVGPPIAILGDCSTELRENDNGCVGIDRSKILREGCHAACKGSQQIGELTFGSALVRVSIPTADRQEAQLHSWIPAHQRGKPCRVIRESVRGRRPVIRS